MSELSKSATRPFFIPGGEPGVLLIHGYLTTPGEMRPLGEHLAAAGLTVSGIRLRGHGTDPRELLTLPWTAWVEDVREGLSELRRHCRSIVLAGLSLGGALALYLAAQEPVTRVIAFSAPDGALARRYPLNLLTHIARWVPTLPKWGSDIRDPQGRRDHATYHTIPLPNTLQLARFLLELDPLLPQIQVPTLLIYARGDRVVFPAAGRRIAAQIGPQAHFLLLERGGHTVVADYDRDRAFAATLDWCRPVSAQGSLP